MGNRVCNVTRDCSYTLDFDVGMLHGIHGILNIQKVISNCVMVYWIVP